MKEFGFSISSYSQETHFIRSLISRGDRELLSLTLKRVTDVSGRGVLDSSNSTPDIARVILDNAPMIVRNGYIAYLPSSYEDEAIEIIKDYRLHTKELSSDSEIRGTMMTSVRIGNLKVFSFLLNVLCHEREKASSFENYLDDFLVGAVISKKPEMVKYVYDMAPASWDPSRSEAMAEAVRVGSAEIVTLLHSFGIGWNERSGRSAVKTALTSGNIGVLDALLKVSRNPVTDMSVNKYMLSVKNDEYDTVTKIPSLLWLMKNFSGEIEGESAFKLFRKKMTAVLRVKNPGLRLPLTREEVYVFLDMLEVQNR